MTRSTAALIIAVLFHLLILLCFWLLGMVFAEHKIPPKKEETRIRVALKEMPEAKKNAAVKNRQKPQEKIPPMPKGSQLEKLVKPVSRTQPLPRPQEQIQAKPPQPARPQKKIPTPQKIAKPRPETVKTEPVPPEKPYIPFLREDERKVERKQAESEQNATRVPEQHKALFAKLSKRQKNVTRQTSEQRSNRREGLINQNLKELYGDEFGRLSEGERKYLLDNQEIMRRLTQEQLNRTGRTDIPNNLRVNDDNIIEFYLHPNGDMTGFRFINHSGFFLLDQVTKDTIESVFWKYPRPKQTTLIRYKFRYLLRGY